MSATRRLAAILAADVVGHSRLMGEDEAGRRWTLFLAASNAAPTYQEIAKIRCVPARPLSCFSPIGAKRKSPASPARSCSVEETRICPPSASVAIRAARITALPK